MIFGCFKQAHAGIMLNTTTNELYFMTTSFDELVIYDMIYFELKVNALKRTIKFYHTLLELEVFYDGQEVDSCSIYLHVLGLQLTLRHINGDNYRESAVMRFSTFNIETVESHPSESGGITESVSDVPDVVSLTVLRDFDNNRNCFAAPPKVRSS